MKYLVKGFWIDDEIDDIEKFRIKLLRDSIKIDVFENDTLLVDAVSNNRCDYSIGIIDLKLETDDGISVANRLKGVFSARNTPLFLPLGTVTGHRALFTNELAKRNPFIFEFEKSEIMNGKFHDFRNSILNYSKVFQLNQEAIKYNDQNPVKHIDPSIFKLKEVFFGYIEDFDDSYFYIRFWNPKDIRSGFTRRYSINVLSEFGITQEIQHVRLSLFETITSRRTDLVPVIEPIGEMDTSIRCKLDDKIDYKVFKKWKN